MLILMRTLTFILLFYVIYIIMYFFITNLCLFTFCNVNMETGSRIPSLTGRGEIRNGTERRNGTVSK